MSEIVLTTNERKHKAHADSNLHHLTDIEKVRYYADSEERASEILLSLSLIDEPSLTSKQAQKTQAISEITTDVAQRNLEQIKSGLLDAVINSEKQTPLLSIVVMFDDANAKKWLEIFLSRLPEISDKNNGLIEVVLSHNVKGDEEKFEYGGITDTTKGITFKRYQYTYTNWYFDNARNAAKSAATGEWILSLDTDEYIDKFQLSKLVSAIGSAEHDIGGINCTVLSHVTKKQGLGIECAPVCRVFRNDPNIQWQSKAHEYVHNSICNENRYAVAESSVVIIHDGYEECTVDGVIAKLNRNYELLCLEVATSQNKAVKEHAKTHSLWTGSEIRKLTGI